MDFTELLSAMRKSSGEPSEMTVDQIDFFYTKEEDITGNHSSALQQVANLSSLDVSNLNLIREEIGVVKLEDPKKFLKHNYNTFTKE